MGGTGQEAGAMLAGYEILADRNARAGFAVIVLTCGLIALRGSAPLLALLATVLRR